jgi:hypothetical protein
MIDTLKLSKGLQKAGMTEPQSEQVAEAFRDAQTDYVTNDRLDAKLEQLKGDLQRFVFGTVVFAAIAQLIAAKLWH